MVIQRLLPSRKFQRIAKFLLVAILVACTVWYYVFASTQQSGQPDTGNLRDVGTQQNPDESKKKPRAPKPVTGELNVHIWRGVCGPDVLYLRQSLLFPQFPDEKIKKVVKHFQFIDDREDYGQRIFGFLKPSDNGSYHFGIASDDSSELWLSLSEDGNEKQLIARVFEENGGAWTTKGNVKKYSEQISKDVMLHGGKKYYMEVVHKQGGGDGFVQVYWMRSKNDDFKLISGEYLSPYPDNVLLPSKKDGLHTLFSGRHSHSLHQKYKTMRREYLKFYSLPLVPKENYLAECDYKTSSVLSGKVYQGEGLRIVYDSNVYPEDDTAMGDPGQKETWPNRLADRDIIQAMSNKIVSLLCLKTSK